MQDGRKAVWSIPYDFVAFFPSLKQNFIAYRSSKMSDYIFELHQQWQSGFCRVYSNCCCNSSFKPEIIKIGQSSHKMYSNNIVNFQESTTILNVHTKKSGNLSYALRTYQVTETYQMWIENAPLAKWEWLKELFLSAHFLVSFCYLVSNFLLLYIRVSMVIYQPLRSGRIWHKVNFLSGVYQVWIQSFHSSRLVASPSLKNLVCPIIYP